MPIPQNDKTLTVALFKGELTKKDIENYFNSNNDDLGDTVTLKTYYLKQDSEQYYFITYSWRFKGLQHNEIMNTVIDTSPMQSILYFKDSYAAEQYTDYKILFAMPITKEEFEKYHKEL